MSTKIKVTKNGPLHVAGEASLIDSLDQTIKTEGDFWLCRCGHSKNKPFCDGSHKSNKFSDEL
jgi:CDGSH-type Zn-finger protein